MGPLARLPSLRSIPFAKRRRPVYDSPDSGRGEECRGGGGNRRRHHLRQGCSGPQNARVLRWEGGFQEGGIRLPSSLRVLERKRRRLLGGVGEDIRASCLPDCAGLDYQSRLPGRGSHDFKGQGHLQPEQVSAQRGGDRRVLARTPKPAGGRQISDGITRWEVNVGISEEALRGRGEPEEDRVLQRPL